MIGDRSGRSFARGSAAGFPAALFAFFLLLAACRNDGGAPTAADGSLPPLLAPFSAAVEMAPIMEAYSASSSCPWGFAHLGIDFAPKGSQAGFQAVADGTVARKELFRNEQNGLWQVNVELRHSAGTPGIIYAFEPWTADRARAEEQLAAIGVEGGSRVVAGQPLGTLLKLGPGAHVHFGVGESGGDICPEPLFTPEARDAILELIRRRYPGAAMCY